ncbi:MAG: DUF6492 family protein, partial [Hyphomicrobiales bacterium]
EYIDENDVLPQIAKDDEFVLNGRNRNGWMRQQIIKLLAFNLVPEAESILIFDTDTAPINPVSFRKNGNPILFSSNEFICSYHKMATVLTGLPRQSRYSFVAHCMMFEKHWLEKLQHKIEQHTGLPWIEAIYKNLDKTTDAAFSEYELYGDFVYQMADKGKVKREYWHNRKIKKSEQENLLDRPWHWKRHTFISHHTHLTN